MSEALAEGVEVRRRQHVPQLAALLLRAGHRQQRDGPKEVAVASVFVFFGGGGGGEGGEGGVGGWVGGWAGGWVGGWVGGTAGGTAGMGGGGLGMGGGRKKPKNGGGGADGVCSEKKVMHR